MAYVRKHTTDVVGFQVVKMEAAHKRDHVITYVKFDTSAKIYNFIRKYKVLGFGEAVTVVDGCEVKYNPLTMEVIDVKRIYDTNGRRVADKGEKSKKATATVNDPIETVAPETTVTVEKDIYDLAWEYVQEHGKDVHHEKYETILTCLDNNIPVYLAGPAGSGKNHTVEQIAKELGWDFYFSNSVQQEYKLTGFIDAGGQYHETEFYKACTSENDCVFFLDEIDASIPEVLVLLNAAIANGYFEFPNDRVELEHVHFVAAGNTVGSGADDMYTGRLVLDQATLDRFAIIEFDYSVRIEMAVAKGNKELVKFVRELSEQANNNGVRATFSYRCITMVTKLEAANMDLNEILKVAVFKGLDKDTINTFVGGTGKYWNATLKVQAAA